MNVNVISQDVHAKEFAGADLTGVLLIAVCQQVFVHVAPAGEHLRTETSLLKKKILLGKSQPVVAELRSAPTLPQMGQGDGSFLYLVPSSPLASSSSLFMYLGPVMMGRGSA